MYDCLAFSSHDGLLIFGNYYLTEVIATSWCSIEVVLFVSLNT